MLIGTVSQASLNHVGLLVVDEIQNVVDSRYGKALVSMLTQLINNSGISICMVGTPICEIFFEKEVQLARRALKERGIPTGKSFNASDIETAVSMYWRGETVKEILEQTGISNRRLYIEIEKRKIPKREKRRGSRNSDFYEKTKNHSDYIVEHYNQGENWTQIARALCMDYNTLKSVIEDAKKKKLIDEKRDCDIELEKERKQASIVASVYMKMEHKPDVKKLAGLFKVDVNRLYYAIGKEKM